MSSSSRSTSLFWALMDEDPNQYERELLAPTLVYPITTCVSMTVMIFAGFRIASQPAWQQFVTQYRKDWMAIIPTRQATKTRRTTTTTKTPITTTTAMTNRRNLTQSLDSTLQQKTSKQTNHQNNMNINNNNNKSTSDTIRGKEENTALSSSSSSSSMSRTIPTNHHYHHSTSTTTPATTTTPTTLSSSSSSSTTWKSFLEQKSDQAMDHALLGPDTTISPIVTDALLSILLGLSCSTLWFQFLNPNNSSSTGGDDDPLFKSLSQAPLLPGKSLVYEHLCPSIAQTLEQVKELSIKQQQEEKEENEQAVSNNKTDDDDSTALSSSSSSKLSSTSTTTTPVLDLTKWHVAKRFRNDHLRLVQDPRKDPYRILWSAHVLYQNCQVRKQYLQQEMTMATEPEPAMAVVTQQPKQQYTKQQQQQEPSGHVTGTTKDMVPFPGLRGQSW